jgi:ABC-type branched-subunit amino acid transport system substrate-binding protein
MSVVFLVRARSSAPIRSTPIESLSGLFASIGGAVARNLLWAVERVNARDGIALPGGTRMLQLGRYDSKVQNEKALSALGAVTDDGARVVMQGTCRPPLQPCSMPSTRTTIAAAFGTLASTRMQTCTSLP